MSITEGTQPAAVQTSGAYTTPGMTTASFTPEAGALIVALISGDGNISASPNVTIAMSDSVGGGTWTELVKANTSTTTAGGYAGVWVRDSPGVSMTVTAIASGQAANGAQLTVRTLIGAKARASQTGATFTAVTTAAVLQGSVAAGTGNKIYGSILDYDAAVTLAMLANTVAISNDADATNGDTWWSGKSSADTAGTATYGSSTSANGMVALAEILAAPAAASALPFNPGRTWKRLFKHPQILPPPPPPAVVVATATPQPIVVTGPTPLPGAVAAVKRATLQDDAVLTTAPPIVQTPQPAPRPAGASTVLRGTLQDDPVLTTRPPVVVIGSTPLPAGVSTQVRSSLIDLATPPPLVINPQPARPVPGALVYSRGTLQDDPVLTTRPPVVTIGQTPLPAGVLAFTARSSLADVVIVTGPTVAPIVNIGQTPLPVGSTTVKRNTLQDDAVLTTPPPIVVAAPKPQTPAGTSSVYRGSLADTPLATPQPVIVIGAAGIPVTPAPYLSRSSYADVVVAVGTPSPIVVASQVKQAAASPLIILRGSLQDDPQLTTKPALVVAAPIRRLSGLHGVRLIVTPNNTDFVTYIPVPPITVTGSDTAGTTVRGVSTAATTAAGVSSPATTAAGVSSAGTTVTGASSPTTTVR